MNRKKLAVILSKLKRIDDDEHKEQHQTDSEVASAILWDIFMFNDVENKVIADFGCGNGIFGIGALELNAKKVYFVEKDKNAVKILKENLDEYDNYEISNDIKDFKEKVDIVIQNPPFGVRIRHLDKKFLKKAMEVSDTIYSLHKIEAESFINAFSRDNNFKANLLKWVKFPLKKQKAYHKKKVHYVKVGVWKFEKTN